MEPFPCKSVAQICDKQNSVSPESLWLFCAPSSSSRQLYNNKN